MKRYFMLCSVLCAFCSLADSTPPPGDPIKTQTLTASFIRGANSDYYVTVIMPDVFSQEFTDGQVLGTMTIVASSEIRGVAIQTANNFNLNGNGGNIKYKITQSNNPSELADNVVANYMPLPGQTSSSQLNILIKGYYPSINFGYYTDTATVTLYGP